MSLTSKARIVCARLFRACLTLRTTLRRDRSAQKYRGFRPEMSLLRAHWLYISRPWSVHSVLCYRFGQEYGLCRINW
jgi:hypothetical protein